MTFDDVKSIRSSVYSKLKYHGDIEAWGNIVLAKWLGQDVNILPFIRKTIDFQYYIKPEHYYYILYFGLKKGKAPFGFYPKKKEVKYKELEERLCELLDWSKRELELNRFVVEHEILNNSKEWEKKLGV